MRMLSPDRVRRVALEEDHLLGTTCLGTIQPGPPDAHGYSRLLPGPGEPLRLRLDLGGSIPAGRVRPLASFVQLTDLHVTDSQSPARAEFLDRYGDPDSHLAREVGRVGTYRAQEALTYQVVEAMSRAVRQLPGGPLTGARLSFALCTGDAADNGQTNELRAYIALLEGGVEVAPDSGGDGSYQGVAGGWRYHPRYWHPDGTPSSEEDDLPRARFGFPEVPGLLDACRRPFLATGLGLPWYAVHGNHDGLLCGTVEASPALAAVAVGGSKLVALGDDSDADRLLAGLAADPSPGDWERIQGPWAEVVPDPRRRIASIREWIGAHLTPRADPVGHGFTGAAAAAGRAWYGFDRGEVRFLILDTANPAGGWQGCVSAEQFHWLEEELLRGHRRFLDERGRVCRSGGEDRLFVLVSHHPLETLVNGYSPGGDRTYLEGDLASLLKRFPNVVLWLNGHTHVNAVRPLPTAFPRSPEQPQEPARVVGGCWQVTSPSCVDWGQQIRSVELGVDEETGQLLIATAMVDHLGVLDPRARDLTDPLVLAGWSRELSANPWQGRGPGELPPGRGTADDRNVLLAVPAPFPLR